MRNPGKTLPCPRGGGVLRAQCAATALALAVLADALPSAHAAQGPSTPATATIVVPVLAQESVAPKWILDGGKVRGLCPEMLAAIERLDPRLRFTGYTRARSLAFIEDAMRRGAAWGGCALVDSPARHQFAVRLAVPLYETRYRLAVASNDGAALADQVRSLDELARRGALVNTARGSGYIDALKARGIEVDDSTGDSVTNLRKTLHGHGRYTYLNEMSMFYYIRAAGLQRQLTVLPPAFDQVMVYFWVSKLADPAVAPAINAALAKLRASGELARIYARWSQLS